jgi:hypothetical protein
MLEYYKKCTFLDGGTMARMYLKFMYLRLIKGVVSDNRENLYASRIYFLFLFTFCFLYLNPQEFFQSVTSALITLVLSYFVLVDQLRFFFPSYFNPIKKPLQ